MGTETRTSPELTTHNNSSHKPIRLINSETVGGYLESCFSKVVGAKKQIMSG